MKRIEADRCVFAPKLFIGLGGAGNELLLIFRALVFTQLGYIPECFRFLAFEFATDPPSPPAKAYPGWLPNAAWENASLRAGEQCFLSLGEDTAALARRMAEGEPSVAWLSQVVPPEVVAAPRGNEGSQVPALTRAALALAADNCDYGGGVCWPDRILEALTALGPAGAAMHQFSTSRRIPATALADGEITAIFLAGSGGGTGTGALLPAAITTRWLARRRGFPVRNHAVVLCGPYRGADGQEQAKAALGYALDLDIEYAVSTPEANLSFPLGPEQDAQVTGRLFDAVYREEASGRLSGDGYYGLLAAAAETLVFRYLSRAGWQIQRSRNNLIAKPVVRGLAAIAR